MARPQRSFDAEAGRVASFAADLQVLRSRSELTLQELSKRANYSISTLSEATSGRKLPTWALTRGYVAACGGDIDEWHARWEGIAELRSEHAEDAPPDVALYLTEISRKHAHVAAQPSRWRTRSAGKIAGVLVFLTLGVLSLAVLVMPGETEAAPIAKSHLTIKTLVFGTGTNSAAARWYTSALFLGTVSAGATGALVTGVVARTASARRVLTCRISDCADENRGVHLAHAARREADRVVHPRFMQVRITNSSRRDIPSRAFDQHRPLELDLNARVVRIIAYDSTPAEFRKPRIKTIGSSLSVGPDLLRSGQVVTVCVLVDGTDPKLTIPEPSIIDTRIRAVADNGSSHKFKTLQAASYAAALGVFASIAAFIVK